MGHDRGAVRRAARRSSSALASATRSTVPSSSRCTGPTPVITADVGPGDLGQVGDLAHPAHGQLDHHHLGVGLDPRTASAARRSRCSRSARLATTSHVRLEQRCRMSLVDVLPVEPVMPTTGARDAAPHLARRPAPSATSGSSHRDPRCGPAAARRPAPATAPAAAPSATNCAPSVRSPGSATNRSPGCDLRASRSRRPVDAPRRSSSLPPVSAAISRAVERDHVRRQRPRAPRARPCGRRTAASGRRTAGPARGPCRRSPPRRPAARRPTAASIAARRSSSTVHRRTPAVISAMIASGSSLRGLSVVTIGAVGQPAGDARPSAGACRGRGRRRSRTHRSARPPVMLAGRRAARSRASRACARSRPAP